MKTRTRQLLWLLPVVFLASVLILGALADWWLESSGGRGLLERELSSSLGLPVRLTGDFRFKLLPRLVISGSGLRIGLPEGDSGLAGCDQYSVAVELIPLLQGELRIASIELQSGFIDLAQLPAETEEAAQSGEQSSFELPRVANLQIEDFSISLAGGGTAIALERFHLVDFQHGKSARFELLASLSMNQDTNVEFESVGSLQVSDRSQTVQAVVDALEISWPDLRLSDLTGALNWEWKLDRIAVELTGPSGSDGQFPFELGLDLSLQEFISGKLTARYFLPAPAAPADLELQFSVTESQVEILQLELLWEGQNITGSGCLQLRDPLELELRLVSDRLDLDRIRPILPDFEGDGGELPLELSVVLEVAEANLSGAVANGLTLEVGGIPDCSSAADQRSP